MTTCGLSDYNSGDYFLVRQTSLCETGDLLYGRAEHREIGLNYKDDSKVKCGVADYPQCDGGLFWAW